MTKNRHSLDARKTLWQAGRRAEGLSRDPSTGGPSAFRTSARARAHVREKGRQPARPGARTVAHQGNRSSAQHVVCCEGTCHIIGVMCDVIG